MTDYDQIEALNWSTLKLLETTPAFALHQIEHPEERKDKQAWKEGRVIHCAYLEPDEFDSRYIVEPVFSGTGSKKAKEEWLASLDDGVEPIKQAEYDMAWRAAEALNANVHVNALTEGASFEHVIQWETDGVKCKGRVDVASGGIVDLKKTGFCTLWEIERDAAKYNYHAQLAWYHDGAVKAGLISGERLPAAILVHASKTSSFVDIAILDMEGPPRMDGTMEYGRAKYQALLKKYIGCKACGWWPGMAHKPIPWVLPDWKLKADEEEVKI